MCKSLESKMKMKENLKSLEKFYKKVKRKGNIQDELCEK
jgi:hypothetical protein